MTVQAFWEPIRRHIPKDFFVSTAVRTLNLTLACVYSICTKGKCKKKKKKKRKEKKQYWHAGSKRVQQENPCNEWCVFSTFSGNGAAVGPRWFPERVRDPPTGFPRILERH